MKALNTSLTSEQAAFALMLEETAPYLMHLWDFQKREFKPAAVESFLRSASHGECIMARFFLAVWIGENRFHFDFIEAANSLDSKSLAVIASWIKNPIFP